MPRVGNKHYSYTPRGRAAAAQERKRREAAAKRNMKGKGRNKR